MANITSIDSDNILTNSITVDTSCSTGYTFSNTALYGSSYNMGINGSSSVISSKNNRGLYVSADAEFDGDVTIKGVSILTTLESIEKRLAILRPDPAKLEKFEALKKAYEQYKTLEALCFSAEDNDGK